MATSRAFKRKSKRDDTPLTTHQPLPEKPPSIEEDDQPTVARFLAMIGLFLTVLGFLAMFAHLWQRTSAISPDWGFRFATVGLCLLLYHTFVESDFQFRRLYGFAALALIVVGIVLRLMAFRTAPASDPGKFMNWFLLYGLPALSIGLIAITCVLRNEDDPQFRPVLLNATGIVGALLIAVAVVQGLRDLHSLATEGTALLILGLLYVSAFIGQSEEASERAYYAAVGLGALGAIGLVGGIVASALPGSNFFVPRGLIIIGMSLVYLTISLGICCDWPVIVIARREVTAYFYSPVGYLVFLGMTVVGGFSFYLFADRMIGEGGFEPVVGVYIFAIVPVIAQMFIYPVITMRLFSEEQQSGTLEVLLTAPVNEISVVLGKFLAAWIFYMMTWLPWWFYLVSMRYVGRESFDYLPIISFSAALAVVSAGLLAMGLFFSAMTSNQIIAAVLTFVGVMMHLVFYFVGNQFQAEGGALSEVFRAINFLDLWQNTLSGIIAPRYLMFHASVAVFFVFSTVKLLESRRWS
ncbi:MAG: hypothetical protein FJ303_07775 [Planctomycetes bacterium]|nr:hypothetical protein [Planctomycetota bacterium]